eukprot:CAMPEP_0173407752 /NCGR_PEP_ID=MMETSP1356-20130122/68009_1 /TAXON_ID=77927 ORGANISM="Hemiselmis virescens, Strain PCC157" /NCGR_SAMPLE_ID=MMETSP1356 /ASSEMBLY_ACC=CAM_ASM_000847 /LENGTH=70 /DNA_ID=CAMNT_0014368975 /DNA_START=162 /DNA_END=370 /DNA_ORIENTATION=-
MAIKAAAVATALCIACFVPASEAFQAPLLHHPAAMRRTAAAAVAGRVGPALSHPLSRRDAVAPLQRGFTG